MESREFLELKNLLLEQKAMLNMLIPKNGTVSYVCDVTGASRQVITSFLKNNFQPEVDYWLKGGKIFLSKNTTVFLLRKYGDDSK